MSKSIFKYFFAITGSFIFISAIIIFLLLKLSYNFTSPTFVTHLLEKKISRTLGADNTIIDFISISKDDHIIKIQIPNIASTTNNETIFLVNLMNLEIDTSQFYKKLKLSLFVTKCDIFSDKVYLGNVYSRNFNSVNAINRFINNKLHLGYMSFSEVKLDDLRIYKDNTPFSFSLAYTTDHISAHNLQLSYLNAPKAAFSINADKNGSLVYINGAIKSFPLWIITSFIPEGFNTDFTKNLDKSFLVDGKINYDFRNVNNPDISLEIRKSKIVNKHFIKNFVLIASNESKSNSLSIKKLLLETTDKGSLNANATIETSGNFFNEKVKISAEIDIKDLHTSMMGYFWPFGVEPETREWLTNGFKQGVIHKGNCKINFDDIHSLAKNDLNAHLDFSSLDLEYYEGYDRFTNLKGSADFDLEAVKITINKGNLLSSKLYPSVVTIEYSDPKVPITIQTAATGKIQDFVHLMGNDIYLNFYDKGIDLKKVTGQLKANVYIKFNIIDSFSLEKAKIDATAETQNFQIALYDKIHLSRGNFQFKLNNAAFSISGPVDINDQPSTIEWTSKMLKHENEFNTKLNIHSIINDNSNFEEIFNNKIRILEGTALLDINYQDIKDKEHITLNLDLNKANIYIPSLGITKEKNVESNILIDLYKNPNESWVSKNLSFKSNSGININGALEMLPNFSEITRLNVSIIYPGSDFNINYTQNQTNRNLNIFGSKINLLNAHLTELFDNNKFINEQPPKSKDKNFDVAIKIDKAVMNNNVMFEDINGEISWFESICKKSDINIKIDEKSKLEIKNINEDNKTILYLHTNNAAKVLSALGLYDAIDGGELEIKMWNVNPGKVLMDPNSVYVGEMNMKNFSAIKNNILTRLVSFSSLLGILNIFSTMDKIPFKKANGYFVLADNVLRINRVNASGSYLTLTMNGTVDWNYNDVNIYGKVVPPVYGLNNLLAYLPFIGHTTADGSSKGLIAADYSITGKIDHTNVTINPLSIFFPSILEKFFL